MPTWGKQRLFPRVNAICSQLYILNSLRPTQNGCHFPDDILNCINLNEKSMNFDKDFTEVCFEGFNQHYTNIGSDNGFAPTRQLTIIWTNDG